MPILFAAYIAVGLFQIAAFTTGVSLYFGLGTIVAVLAFMFIYAIPFGAVVVALLTYYGARYGWHWQWWQAATLAAPGAALSLALYSFGGLMAIFERKTV